MIQPLHEEFARIRYAEMREEAVTRRLVRQANGNDASDSLRRPGHAARFLRWLAGSIAMAPGRLAAAAGRH